MPLITVWFLIIGMPGGGAVAVPQRSVAECLTQANFIWDHRFEERVPNHAYCVPGVR